MKKTIIIIIALLNLNISCVDKNCQKIITVNNNSDNDIYFNWFPNTTSNHYYPPSALVNSNAYWSKVEAHNSKKDKWRDCIENRFTTAVEPFDTLVFYIFDAHILEQELRYEILRRYDLSLQDLQYLNWTITYPPDEKMKNIVMHPPYGE